MKKLSMQEFADTFNMTVAQDKDGSIYAYDDMPTKGSYGWVPHYIGHGFTEITHIVARVENDYWQDSLCLPQPKGVN